MRFILQKFKLLIFFVLVPENAQANYLVTEVIPLI